MLYKAMLFITILLGVTSANAQKFPVYISLNGYEGNCVVDTDEVPETKPELVLNLKPGAHRFGVNKGVEYTQFGFFVDELGKVYGITNTDAAFLKDTTVMTPQGNKVIAKIVCKTTKVTIDPNGAIYSFSAAYRPYPNFQPGNKKKTFTLIKGLSYFIASSYNSFTMGGKCEKYTDVNGKVTCVLEGGYKVPDLFLFTVDAGGNVKRYSDDPIHTMAATYGGATIKLNTVKVTIDPKDFRSTSISMPGDPVVYKKATTFTLIKGLGLPVKYSSDLFFYIIPM